MQIDTDILALEVNGFIQLFELDLSRYGGKRLYFHPYAHSGIIKWRGKEYHPWAIEAKGFAKKSEGTQAAPTITVGNIAKLPSGEVYVGVITQLCLQFNDLVGCHVVRRQTLAKYLDDGETPNTDEHLPDEIWLIEQKQSETREAVTFALKSTIDFNGAKIPGRIVDNNFVAGKEYVAPIPRKYNEERENG